MLGKLQASIKKRFSFFSSIILLPWLLVLFLRWFGPIEHKESSIEMYAFLFLFIITSYLSFIFGFLYEKPYLKNNIASKTHSPVFIFIFKVIMIMAYAYPILSFYDFTIVKGATLSTIVEQRESEYLTGPRNSLIGAIVALLSGSPAILLALLFTHKFIIKSSFINKLTLFFIMIGFASMFLSGGRNSFFISIIFVFLYYIFFSSRIESIKKISFSWSFSKKILIAVLFMVAFIYSMNIFLDRFTAYGFDVGFMITYLEIEYDVNVYKIDSQDNFLISIYSVVVYLIFYVTHAFTYLNDYFTTNYSPFLFGSYNLPQLARLFDLFLNTDYFNSGRERMLQVGTYLSLPGSIFIDFGFYGSLVFASILGATVGYLSRNLVFLSLYQRLILTYLCVALIFSPIYGVFGMANGFSILFTLMLVYFLSLRMRF